MKITKGWTTASSLKDVFSFSHLFMQTRSHNELTIGLYIFKRERDNNYMQND